MKWYGETGKFFKGVKAFGYSEAGMVLAMLTALITVLVLA